MINKLPNIILLGAPGSGKGTIAQLLVKKYNYKQLSTGDLFRETSKLNTPFGSKIKEIIASGQLINDDITNEIIASYIKQCLQDNIPFILDGYPRTINQAKFLKSICDIDCVIYLDIPFELALKRITGRLTCLNCHTIYNSYFKKPKIEGICDICGSKLNQREDDKLESAKKRFNVYQTSTFDLVNYYRNEHKLITIKIDESNSDLLPKIEKIINK